MEGVEAGERIKLFREAICVHTRKREIAEKPLQLPEWECCIGMKQGWINFLYPDVEPDGATFSMVMTTNRSNGGDLRDVKDKDVPFSYECVLSTSNETDNPRIETGDLISSDGIPWCTDNVRVCRWDPG